MLPAGAQKAEPPASAGGTNVEPDAASTPPAHAAGSASVATIIA
ncbi:MAG: hypothetical protein WBD27_08140 [Pyrinomonadaceae bacterium]